MVDGLLKKKEKKKDKKEKRNYFRNLNDGGKWWGLW